MTGVSGDVGVTLYELERDVDELGVWREDRMGRGGVVECTRMTGTGEQGGVARLAWTRRLNPGSGTEVHTTLGLTICWSGGEWFPLGPMLEIVRSSGGAMSCRLSGVRWDDAEVDARA